jgi:peptidoglycan/xylan/chitin deacetylase (PgdA/CDA1 family)
MKRSIPKIHHILLMLIYLFYSIFEPLLDRLGVLNTNKLRVLLYHDIPPDLINNFKQHLLYLEKKWKFVTPDEFSEMIDGKLPIQGKNLLLTFDDGFLSNKIVADEVLNVLNIKALFFIIPDFVNISDTRISKSFILNNIFPGMQNIQLKDYQVNMKWNDIQHLLNCGHKIGAHTMSHARLSMIQNKEELKLEIINCAKNIETNLKIKVKHFAFPFGNLYSINKYAYDIIKDNYKFLHTGLRGENFKKSTIILRDAIKPSDSKFLVASYLSGISDFFYKNSILKMKKW